MIRLRASKASSCTIDKEQDTDGYCVSIQLFGRVLLELWVTAR